MEINFDVINNKDIVKVISGCNHVVILSEQRHVYAFGNKEFGETGIIIVKN
jgi:alpha-tubulin suppressor-like RCC1 family protein